MPLGAAVHKLEARRQVVNALQFKLCTARGKIDDLAVDRLRIRAKQESSDARDQPLRLDPEITSFIGPAHVQLCDKPAQCI